MLAACSIGGDPSLEPTKFCEASEASAVSRGMNPGDIVQVKDGCTPSEREFCGEFVNGTFLEAPCD